MTPNTLRLIKTLVRSIPVTIAASLLAGCVSTSADVTGRYADPIGNAPVISNETPYSRALECIAGYNNGRAAPRIAVGQIADYTGKEDADGGGRKITQGAALMAISALSKSGARLVERFDTSVAELELKYANNKLIGNDQRARQEANYRKILAGSIPGSDFYLVGGITELNYNIRSQGVDAFVADTDTYGLKGSAGGKAYVMNVGLDLRLVDTKTLEVVDVISYQKQIVGREIRAGVFDILGGYIIDVGVGDSALEPIQLAVRSVIERAVLEMMSRRYGTSGDACRSGGDPLDDGYAYNRGNYGSGQDYGHEYPDRYTPASSSSYSYNQPNQEYHYEQARNDPYSGYSAGDVNVSASLRGGIQ